MRGVKNSTESFWYNVDTHGECWNWRGFKYLGYGQVSWNGKMRRAHRVAAFLAGKLGKLDSPELVLHHCDNPACCRPDHLYIGKQLQNMRDRSARGRAPIGQKHGMAKLRDSQVLMIKSLLSKGLKQTEIANVFGVSKHAIWRIAHGINHKHI